MKFVTGDILTPNTEENGVLVCHQVNCQGVMGAGLAKQIKTAHPGVFALYKEKCKLIQTGIGGLGDVQFCSVLADSGYLIANIFGQDGYGRDKQYTDYAALEEAFRKIAEAFPTYTIRIPYMMGCGLGGGKWEVVAKIIERTLAKKNIDIEIWCFQKEG